MSGAILAEAGNLGRALPALLVEANRVAETVLQGTHGRRRVGLGESFWQFRAYEQGDPASSIDWRQSARGDRLYIRETEREAAQSLWLWRDSSASMDYASTRDVTSKRTRADLLLMALATLALRGGERVGLLSDAPTPPVTGQAGIGRLAAELATIGGDLPPPQPLRRHATVVLFGDFLGPLPPIAKAVEDLSVQGAHGIIVQILDPAELSLPFSGRVRFEGFEGEGDELVPRAERLRADYRDRLAAQQSGLERIALRANWRLCLDRTDRPALTTLSELHQFLSGER